ncbi:hypothetical protein GEMRC1_011017 [Eukaryota sp. GEM-RC1]
MVHIHPYKEAVSLGQSQDIEDVVTNDSMATRLLNADFVPDVASNAVGVSERILVLSNKINKLTIVDTYRNGKPSVQKQLYDGTLVATCVTQFSDTDYTIAIATSEPSFIHFHHYRVSDTEFSSVGSFRLNSEPVTSILAQPRSENGTVFVQTKDNIYAVNSRQCYLEPPSFESLPCLPLPNLVAFCCCPSFLCVLLQDSFKTYSFELTLIAEVPLDLSHVNPVENLNSMVGISDKLIALSFSNLDDVFLFSPDDLITNSLAPKFTIHLPDTFNLYLRPSCHLPFLTICNGHYAVIVDLRGEVPVYAVFHNETNQPMVASSVYTDKGTHYAIFFCNREFVLNDKKRDFYVARVALSDAEIAVVSPGLKESVVVAEPVVEEQVEEQEEKKEVVEVVEKEEKTSCEKVQKEVVAVEKVESSGNDSQSPVVIGAQEEFIVAKVVERLSDSISKAVERQVQSKLIGIVKSALAPSSDVFKTLANQSNTLNETSLALQNSMSKVSDLVSKTKGLSNLTTKSLNSIEAQIESAVTNSMANTPDRISREAGQLVKSSLVQHLPKVEEVIHSSLSPLNSSVTAMMASLQNESHQRNKVLGDFSRDFGTLSQQVQQISSQVGQLKSQKRDVDLSSINQKLDELSQQIAKISVSANPVRTHLSMELSSLLSQGHYEQALSEILAISDGMLASDVLNDLLRVILLNLPFLFEKFQILRI